jgi:signal transduction histidine kinase
MIYFVTIGLVSVVLTGLLSALIAPLIVTLVQEVQIVNQDTIIQTTTTDWDRKPLPTTYLQAIIISAMIAALLAMAVSWQVSRRITLPISRLAAATRAVSEGNYDRRVPVGSRDEIGELAEHFNLMAQSMSATEQTRQALIADISHELRTPLASVKGMIEGFQDQVIEANTENYGLILDEIDRLQRLIHDLNELSVTATGVLHLQPVTVSPEDILSAVVSKMRSQFETKNVKLLEISSPSPLGTIQVDRARIEQVVINLLGNSLQYTDEGGCVQVGVKRLGFGVRFEVHDTGIGLHRDNLQKIFQRFFRVDKSRARITGGSGIGLTIAKNIIEAHGGEIWAESNGPGFGTSILFELPDLPVLLASNT